MCMYYYYGPTVKSKIISDNIIAMGNRNPRIIAKIPNTFPFNLSGCFFILCKPIKPKIIPINKNAKMENVRILPKILAIGINNNGISKQGKRLEEKANKEMRSVFFSLL